MINFLLSLNLSIAVAGNAHLNPDKDLFFAKAEQQNGLIGLVIIEQPIIKNFSALYIHASELSDGFQGTDDDRDYLGIMYNF